MEREDIIKSLNRLSSLIYVLVLKFSSGDTNWSKLKGLVRADWLGDGLRKANALTQQYEAAFSWVEFRWGNPLHRWI